MGTRRLLVTDLAERLAEYQVLASAERIIIMWRNSLDKSRPRLPRLGRPAEQYDAKAISGYMDEQKKDEQKKVMIQQWVEGQAAILILCPPPDHHTGIKSIVFL